MDQSVRMLLSLLAVAGCATGGPASSKNTDSAVDSDTGMVNDSGTEDSGGQDSFNVTDVADLAWATWRSGTYLYNFGYAWTVDGLAVLERDGQTPLVAITEAAGDDVRNLVGLFEIVGGEHTSDEYVGLVHGTVVDAAIGIGNALPDVDGDGADELFVSLQVSPPVGDDVSIPVAEVESSLSGDSRFGNGTFSFLSDGADGSVPWTAVSLDRLGTGHASLAFAPYSDGATTDLLVYDDPTAGSVTAEEADTVVSKHAWSDYFGNTLTADVNDDGYDDLVASFAADTTWLSILFGPVEDGASLDAADVSLVPSSTDASQYSYLGDVRAVNLDGQGGADLAWDGAYDGQGEFYQYFGLMGIASGDYEFADVSFAFDVSYDLTFAATGDLDGDGLSDVVFNARATSASIPNTHCLTVVWSPLTSSSGVGANWLCDAAGLEVSTTSLGDTVDATHDVDGDGLADLFITAPGDLGATQYGLGIVYLVPGSAMVTLKP